MFLSNGVRSAFENTSSGSCCLFSLLGKADTSKECTRVMVYVDMFYVGFSSKAASINHVDKKGRRGVSEKTMFVHMGGGRVRGLSTWTKKFLGRPVFYMRIQKNKLKK